MRQMSGQANDAGPKERKKRLQGWGSISLLEAMVMAVHRGLGGQVCEKTSRRGGDITVGELRVQLCSKCKKPDHNARSCQVVCKTFEVSTPSSFG